MIEVLKQMVEALEWCHGGEPIGTAEAIEAGKQAIAKLESQEPVAWFRYQQGSRVYYDTKKWDDCVPLFTHPPQRTWVGLTEEEVQDAGRFSYCRGGTSEKLYHIMWNSQPSACIGWSREELIDFAHAVEAKYQEKNQ
jgi:hypothetical protein